MHILNDERNVYWKTRRNLILKNNAINVKFAPKKLSFTSGESFIKYRFCRNISLLEVFDSIEYISYIYWSQKKFPSKCTPREAVEKFVFICTISPLDTASWTYITCINYYYYVTILPVGVTDKTKLH